VDQEGLKALAVLKLLLGVLGASFVPHELPVVSFNDQAQVELAVGVATARGRRLRSSLGWRGVVWTSMDSRGDSV
jgi:nitrate/nitrite transporter NarK